MSKKSRTFASLLQDMPVDDVKTLIQERIILSYANIEDSKETRARLGDLTQNLFELNEDFPKYKIHINYIIDPHDIIEFCFPFGFNMARSDGADMDRKADTVNTWDNFFMKSIKILLMDQHKDELDRLRNRLVREMKANINEFAEFEKRVVEIFNFKSDKLSPEEIDRIREELFNKRLKWLWAAGTGELHKGPQRFKNILKKLIIHSHQFDENIVAPWVTNKNEQGLHIERIKDIFVDTQATDSAYSDALRHIDRLKKRNIEVDEIRQQNILVDFMVVNRLLNINRQFESIQEELDCRYIFLYLSSDSKSEYISDEMESQFPTFFNRPFNLMRNVSQLYLNTIFSVKLSEFKDSALSKDQLFEQIVQNLTLAHNAILNRQTEPDSEIDKLISSLRERIEWSAQMKQIMSYPENLEKVFLQLKEEASFEPLKQAFGELINALKKNEENDSLSQLVTEIRNFNVQVTVLQKIKSILNKNPTPDISSQGYVVGINHHLPTLFKKVDPVSKYERLLDKTVKLILSPIEMTDFAHNLKTLLNEVKDELLVDELPDISSGLNRESIADELQHYKRECLLHLIALLLPSENIRKQLGYGQGNLQHVYYLDNELDQLLTYDIKTLERKINRISKEQPEKKKLSTLLDNLIYIKTWLLRRNNRLDECDEFLTLIMHEKDRRNDIRFIHGRALLSYSRLTEEFENNHINLLEEYVADKGLQVLLKKTELDIRNALKAFESYDRGEFDPLILSKAHSALLNTLIYMEVLSFGMSRNPQKLKSARILLDEKMSKFDFERRSHPEYLHTEANLEYFEALNYIKNRDKFGALKKLGHSDSAIIRCIQMYTALFPKKKIDIDYVLLKEAIEETKETIKSADF